MASTVDSRPASSAPTPAQVELILARIDALPTLSGVALRLLELVRDERSSARDLVGVISADQSLAARILSMARRADRGTKADTIERAVIALGFNAVRNLALSIQVFETFSHQIEHESARFDRLGFWKHSLAVGCAAHLLAGTDLIEAPAGAPRASSEEAFICGLLHDVGKVVLSACFPKSYDRVVERSENLLDAIAEHERQIFGLDHTLAGRRLATHWRLPPAIEQAIWLHHHAPASTPRQIAYPHHVQLVQVADVLVRQMRIGYSGSHALDELTLTEIAGRPHADKALQKVRTALIDLVQERAELIGLDRISSSEVYEEALGQANRELAQINAQLADTNRRLNLRSDCFEALQRFKAGVGDEPAHETIALSALDALAYLLPGEPIAFAATSPTRGMIYLAARAGDGLRPDSDALPLIACPPLNNPTADTRGWQPAGHLPGPIRDRLAAMLGVPATCCWQFEAEPDLAAAVVLTGQPPRDLDDNLRILTDWIATWLHLAESRRQTARLNEELADMNRRVVGSQAELARMRSVAMVGQMAAGAAHELNNPLAVISGRAQMLARDANDEPTRRSAALISEHAHKASAIVTELMEFAKPHAPKPARWAMPELLADLRRDGCEKALWTEDQLTLQLSDELPEVWADRQQVRLLLDEILRNAVEATRDSVNRKLLINCQPDLADDRIVVRIEDNGVGMSPDVLEHALDPFFSFRPAGRGRGLGLSRAARYAEINGGRIRLASRPREGTVVLLTLPIAQAAEGHTRGVGGS